jgi:hypothetical protein
VLINAAKIGVYGLIKLWQKDKELTANRYGRKPLFFLVKKGMNKFSATYLPFHPSSAYARYEGLLLIRLREQLFM